LSAAGGLQNKKIMDGKKVGALIQSLRPSQWIKNLAVFAPILFTGKLLDPYLFGRTWRVFVAFCFLSSSSYLLNDIVDVPLDRKHPFKKKRPIARGIISISLAARVSLVLALVGLLITLSLGFTSFIISFLFYSLHIVYSFLLKKMVLWDILGIATSFTLRAFAGEVATGYHLSIWLTFTVIFLSLLIASGKRRSELALEGTRTRPVLSKYQKDLLDFYVSIFAVATLISYAMFTYFAEAKGFGENLVRRFGPSWSFLVGRKWLMLTLIPVIMGIMRYAYLVFSRHRGERPERMLTADFTLLFIVLSWGFMLVLIMYVI